MFNLELQIILLLAILIFFSKVAGHLSLRYLRQPIVFGEILVGLLLGPSLLNIFAWPVFAGSTALLQNTVNILAHIGVLLLMFIAGLETNVGQMRRVGMSAFVTGTCGMLLPLALGLMSGLLFGLPFNEALFIGVVLTATSVSISAQTLMEIDQLRSKEGATILGAAVIDDVEGIIVLSLVIAFLAPHAELSQATLIAIAGGSGILKILLTIAGMALFFFLAFIIGKYGIPWILRFADRMHASYAIPATALLLVFLFAMGAEYIGQVAAITGAYIAGLFLARTPFRKQIERAINPFTYAFFVPIFFASIGLSTNARSLTAGSWIFVIVISLIAIVSKMIGCGGGARITGCSNQESIRIGIGMISRGEVGLIVAQIGLTAGIIGQPYYATMVVMVLATTMVTPILLRFSFPRAVKDESKVNLGH